MTGAEGWNVDQPVNQKLGLWLSSFFTIMVRYHPSVTENKILMLKLLRLEQELTANQE